VAQASSSSTNATTTTTAAANAKGKQSKANNKTQFVVLIVIRTTDEERARLDEADAADVAYHQLRSRALKVICLRLSVAELRSLIVD
jgi:hypothetical protein